MVDLFDYLLHITLQKSNQAVRMFVSSESNTKDYTKNASVRVILKARILANIIIARVIDKTVLKENALKLWKSWTFDDALKLKSGGETNLYWLIQNDIEERVTENA